MMLISITIANKLNLLSNLYRVAQNVELHGTPKNLTNIAMWIGNHVRARSFWTEWRRT